MHSYRNRSISEKKNQYFSLLPNAVFQKPVLDDSVVLNLFSLSFSSGQMLLNFGKAIFTSGI